MPHARIDVAFVREHFAAVPEKTRPAALALYLELVITSAELLLDGVLPLQVVLAGAHEIGISRGRYARSEVHKIGTSLAESGLVELHENDNWTLIYWAEHHSARDYVEGRRKADADRKARARGQLTLGDDTALSTDDVRGMSAADNRGTPRGRAHKSESETKNYSSSTSSRPAPPDDDDLRLRLEQLNVNDAALIAAATNDPARAAAWIDHAHTHADRNPAGYFRTNFTTGTWPPNTNGKPPTDPAERRKRFLHGDGHLLPDDELEYQLRAMGATDDEVIEAVDTAHDLREVPT